MTGRMAIAGANKVFILAVPLCACMLLSCSSESEATGGNGGTGGSQCAPGTMEDAGNCWPMDAAPGDVGNDSEQDAAPGDVGNDSEQDAASEGEVGDADAPSTCQVPEDCVGFDDGDLCNGTFRCSEGSCVFDPNSVVHCPSPGGACRSNVCDPQTGGCVLQTDPDGTACDDGAYCTATDRCVAGSCVGSGTTCTPSCQVCNEGEDRCDLAPGHCLIGGDCVAFGTVSTSNACAWCAPTAPLVWSEREAGTPCDLDESCSVQDVCDGAGACVMETLLAPSAPRPYSPMSASTILGARPVLRWTAPPGDGCSAPTYEVEVDDSCSGDFDNCAFSSPELTQPGIVLTTYQPSADLAASSIAPVGTRYAWRVRACRATSCSDWSRVMVFQVGRPSKDINGDGYSDLVVAQTNPNPVAVYAGGPGGLAQTPESTVVASGSTDLVWHDARVAAADVNGDGFADVIIAPVAAGTINVHFGSATGVTNTPNIAISGPPRLGEAMSVSGDVNGDGYPDIVAGAGYEHTPEMLFVYFGGPSGPSVDPDATVRLPTGATYGGYSFVDSAGDLNGDGIADIAFQGALGSSSRLYVVNGGTLSLGMGTSGSTFVPTAQDFGFVSNGGDIDGDGLHDLFVGAPTYKDDPNGWQGAFFYFRGSSSFPPVNPTSLVSHPLSGQAVFGRSGAVCDVDADGHGDAIVGGTVWDGVNLGGFAAVYPGTAAGVQSTPAVVMTLTMPSGKLGTDIACAGDVNADGFDDVAISDSGYGSGQVGAVFVYQGSPSGLSSDFTMSIPNFDPNGYGFGKAIAH